MRRVMMGFFYSTALQALDMCLHSPCNWFIKQTNQPEGTISCTAPHFCLPLITAMIGSDIPGDSHIKDQNTNGLLSQRWQLVVRVYNLAVISTNLMNEITIIHHSLSPSLLTQTVCSALEPGELKGVEERLCFLVDGRKVREKDRMHFPSLLWRRASPPLGSF